MKGLWTLDGTGLVPGRPRLIVSKHFWHVLTFDRKLNTFQHSFDLCHSDKVESLSRPECKHCTSSDFFLDSFFYNQAKSIFQMNFYR